MLELLPIMCRRRLNEMMIREHFTDIGWRDPLAQSFISESTTGEFITKIDVFFSTKDSTIPVTLQIREMDNGFLPKKLYHLVV